MQFQLIKKITYILLYSFICLTANQLFAIAKGESAFSTSNHEGYHITVKVNGVADTLCYLAYHHGHKVYVKDTFAFDSRGVSEMKGNELLKSGIYLVIVPGHQYFEFLIDGPAQHFSLETDVTDYVSNMKVEQSNVNQLFQHYQQFLKDRHAKITKYKNRLKEIEEGDSISIYEKQIRELNAEIADYRIAYQEQHTETFLAKMFASMAEPVVPDTPLDENGAPVDKNFAVKYYKAHFWDNVDFSDERLIHTPILYNKTKQYLEKLTIRYPDSIMVAADLIIEKAKVNEAVFQYIVTYVTHSYETSKYVGMDAVFVYLAEKYYLSGDAFWMDSIRLAKVDARVKRLKPNLIGKVAPELLMLDTQGQEVSLHALPHDFIVVYFWDYKCGHCKRNTPKLKEFYEKYKDQNVEIFSICTRVEKKPWLTYLNENKIMDWINVMDPYNKTNFRALYDMRSTPMVYLLDKDKKILSKRISVEQLDGMLSRLMQKEK